MDLFFLFRVSHWRQVPGLQLYKWGFSLNFTKTKKIGANFENQKFSKVKGELENKVKPIFQIPESNFKLNLENMGKWIVKSEYNRGQTALKMYILMSLEQKGQPFFAKILKG